VGDDPGEIHPPPARRRVSFNASNFRIQPTDAIGTGSLKRKFQGNLAAIRLLRRLQEEERPATEEEKQVLVRYVGWGGIPQAFAWHENDEWQKDREILKELLSRKEYDEARASTLNAHYTSPEVISGIYEAVDRLGFDGGRILEPALGIGHFFGLMPQEMSQQSRLTGIEMDSITAEIAKKLYPDADIRHQPFENAALVDASYDLAISNVPFGDYRVHDPQFNDHHFLIHDYFFARSVEKVRPGGLIVFITSKGTLDKAGSYCRGYLDEKADFLGAIRLPNTAFKSNANTEVTTDIVFLRKRVPGERRAGHAWVELAEHRNADGQSFEINEYFAEHPEMMLGTMEYAGTMYRHQESTLLPDDRKLGDALREAILHLPEKVFRQVNRTVEAPRNEAVLAPDDLKEGNFAIHEGEVMIRSSGVLVAPVNLSREAGRRIRGLIKIRDAVRDVLRTQLRETGEEEIISSRRQLNLQYDHFVSRFGPISHSANRRAFRGDPDLPLLCSLEDYDQETRRAAKMAIFHERTIAPQKLAESAETAQDALVLTLNETGRVDLSRIEALLKRPLESFLPELEGMIFRNPQTEEWETDDQYLSGDVRLKLEDAKAAAIANPQYQQNVAALEAVQPVDLTPGEVDARLGAAWIPASDVEGFARSLLDCHGVTVSHSVELGTWYVKGDYQARNEVSNTVEWGTSRYPALDLIQDALNLRTPTVYDKVPQSDNRVVNAQETEAARDRLEKIKERFKTWIWEDEERCERLCRFYNDEFNNTRLRVFNGNHLTLPSSSQQVTLRPHQKDGVWRIIQSDNTLLAHVVGAGKTFTMVAAGIELKRLGLATKPMYVVPNHMLEQFSTELLALYPTANILVAGKNDFEASRRARLFSRIATGIWDAVIVTHSSFEKIPISTDTLKELIEDQIREVENAIRKQSVEVGTRAVKDLERTKKRLTTKLENLADVEKKDNTLTFEELGVDRLFIDEAHKFKNLFYVTKMTRVAGLPQTASNRAFDMFVKIRMIQEKNGGGGVVFATGTPISNTMAEMYTMQRYLQPQSLQRRCLQHFDSWAGTFGETVSAMELSPNGSGYRLQTRFARFINIPELMQQFRQVADVQTAESLKLPIPKLDQGRPVTVSAPTTPALKAFVDSLVKRTEAIKNGSVRPDVDNMLNITTEGRKAALDLRLVLPDVREAPDSKINLAVEKVYRIWQDATPTKGTQMIFCDLSTPSANREKFSVYTDLRDKLVQHGIPENEIAFVQDYDDDLSKAALFKSVREGNVRVLIGSTLKMGEGTNVQKRLIALHHLDAPWRPADIEQREGRILRQGNQNESVKIFRYVTEGSFDAYMWQTLETKCRFISQIMTGDATVRRAEDVDAAALTYAEVKAIASGNPLVIEKASVDAEVMRLTRLKRQYTDSHFKMRYGLRNLTENIRRCEKDIADLETDLSVRTPTRGDLFSMQVNGVTFTSRKEAGSELIAMASKLNPFKSTPRIGMIAGFPVSIQRTDDSVTVRVHGKGREYAARLSESAVGTISSIENTIESIAADHRNRKDDLAQYRRRREDLKAQLENPFEHEEKLTASQKRQQEIVEELDLTRDQAPTTASETEEETPGIEEKAARRVGSTCSVAMA